MSRIIDDIETQGNLFIDTIVKPIAKGSTNILINENKYVKSFLMLKTAFMENKISQFIKFLQDESEEDIMIFIDNLDNNEKTHFIETINKIIDLDDSFQIYILTRLLIKRKVNKELNYWEKSLYYNIKLFSEDDFLIFYRFLEDLTKPIQYKKNYGTSKETKDEINLIIKKFQTIGIISLYSGGFAAECINLTNKHDYSLAFSFYPFVDDLYEIIDNFIKYNNN